MKYEITINGARRTVEFSPPKAEGSRVAFQVDGRSVESDAMGLSRGSYSVLLGGRSLDAAVEETPSGLLVRVNGREYSVTVADPRAWSRGRGGGVELEGRQQLLAPMPGKIVRVLVKVGEQVAAGQGLLVIEAMKMQNEVRSPKSGALEKLAREGQTVNAGEVLAVVS